MNANKIEPMPTLVLRFCFVPLSGPRGHTQVAQMSVVAQVNANQGTPIKRLIGRLIARDEELAQGKSAT